MPRRQKVFGAALPNSCDRNEKARLLFRLRSFNHRARTRGQHGGPIPHAHVNVLWAIVSFCGRAGLIFPSYEAIAARANVARSTVALAIRNLEAHGFITWANRLWRAQVDGRRRVFRTSNTYMLTGFLSKSDYLPGPIREAVIARPKQGAGRVRIAESRLGEALARLGGTIFGDRPPD